MSKHAPIQKVLMFRDRTVVSSGGSRKRSTPYDLYLLLLPATLFIVGLSIYPVLYNVMLSTRAVTMMTLGSRDAQHFIGLDNYQAVLSNTAFPAILTNSVLFTIGSVSFQFIIGFALALLGIRNVPLARFSRGAIVIGWVLPPVVVAVLWRWLLNGDIGIINYVLMNIGVLEEPVAWLTRPDMALYGVIGANIWFGIPFNMMLLTGGLSGLPNDVFEFASIDGANALQRFVYLTIPMMRRTIAATLMLGIIYTFKVFALIWVMTGGGPVNATNVLTTWSYQFSFEFFDVGQGAAIANVLFVLMFVISIFYVRRY